MLICTLYIGYIHIYIHHVSYMYTHQGQGSRVIGRYIIHTSFMHNCTCVHVWVTKKLLHLSQNLDAISAAGGRCPWRSWPTDSTFLLWPRGKGGAIPPATCLESRLSTLLHYKNVKCLLRPLLAWYAFYSLLIPQSRLLCFYCFDMADLIFEMVYIWNLGWCV